AAIRSMDAAAAAGVNRYVMVSYFGAGPDHGVPQDNPFHAYADAKTAADAYLQATDLAWTILRPSGLTLEAATGHISAGDGVTAGQVSRDNVAHVIRAVVAHPDTTSGRVIAFNDGPSPIDEVVAGA
ncbi:MAG: NAD(P)-binding oxidoreductase, partial [Terrabacter sp.]